MIFKWLRRRKATKIRDLAVKAYKEATAQADNAYPQYLAQARYRYVKTQDRKAFDEAMDKNDKFYKEAIAQAKEVLERALDESNALLIQ